MGSRMDGWIDNNWKDGCTDILNKAHFYGPCNFMSGSKLQVSVKTAIVLATMAAFHEKRHKT